MNEHQAQSDEIECILGQWVRFDVMLSHLDIWQPQIVEKSSVEIRRQHMARRSHSLAEPPRDCPAAGADLQTSPALAYAELCEVANGAGIIQSGQRSHPLLRLLFGVVEDVAFLHSGSSWW